MRSKEELLELIERSFGPDRTPSEVRALMMVETISLTFGKQIQEMSLQHSSMMCKMAMDMTNKFMAMLDERARYTEANAKVREAEGAGGGNSLVHPTMDAHAFPFSDLEEGEVIQLSREELLANTTGHSSPRGPVPRMAKG